MDVPEGKPALSRPGMEAHLNSPPARGRPPSAAAPRGVKALRFHGRCGGRSRCEPGRLALWRQGQAAPEGWTGAPARGPGGQTSRPGRRFASAGRPLGGPRRQLGPAGRFHVWTGRQLGRPGRHLGPTGRRLGRPGRQLGPAGRQLGRPGRSRQPGFWPRRCRFVSSRSKVCSSRPKVASSRAKLSSS